MEFAASELPTLQIHPLYSLPFNVNLQMFTDFVENFKSLAVFVTNLMEMNMFCWLLFASVCRLQVASSREGLHMSRGDTLIFGMCGIS